MSNLSDLIPAGGGQNNTDFVADGAIASGKPVILTAAGKAAEVAMGPGSDLGTAVVFESATTQYLSATFDSSSNKVVIAYQDYGNSAYGTAVVGTVSGTAISFGTPVVFNSDNTIWIAATFDSDSNKVVVAYRPTSGEGTAVVGTVSGTAISYGTPVVFAAVATYRCSATFDSDSNKVVIAYQDANNSSYGTAVVGTVSGTAISFGSAAVFESASVSGTGLATTFDSNSNKVVIAYPDAGSSSYGTAVVGTVSGTAISFGTPVVFEAAGTYNIAATFDSNSNKAVFAYRDNGNSDYGTGIVGTVSGTAISFGTPVVFETAWVNYVSATFDSDSNKVVIAYADEGNSNYGTVIQGTVSGTAISYGATVVYESANAQWNSATFDSNSNKVVIAYADGGNSDYGTGVVYSTTASNMTAANLLGIASGAILDTATGTINTWGSRNEVQTSLTIASDYYAQDDGTITTSDGGQLLGKALSATMINIKDYTG